MKIVFLELPGRFPTMCCDLGVAFDILAAEGYECLSVNSNYNWWKFLCSDAYVSMLARRYSLPDILSSKFSPRANVETVSKLAQSAASSLLAMKTKASYTDAASYVSVVKPLSDYLRLLNYLQPEFRLFLDSGPNVDGLDYSSSSALAAYAACDTLLFDSISSSLSSFPRDADVCFLYISSASSLLTGIIAARILRSKIPNLYISLLSHGYENFFLDHVAPGLVKAGTLFESIDSIVRHSHERDSSAVYLARKLIEGKRPVGLIENVPVELTPVPNTVSQSIDSAFSPETVYWTRLSSSRCYWNRCSFCVQNLKNADNIRLLSNSIELSVSRISALLSRGCHYFYFCDEALHPKVLDKLCCEIEKRKLHFSWGCRCRIDAGYSRELLARMKTAGCYEVLFGVESVVPRVQLLMNKYDSPLSEPEILRVVNMVKTAGLGVHLTFLVCFPGEVLAETEASIRFAVSALKDAELATYYFNTFVLYPGSGVHTNPTKYGIVPEQSCGDLNSAIRYSFADKRMADEYEKIKKTLPRLISSVEEDLGWSKLNKAPEYAMCRDLYFNYAHGAYLKASGVDILKPIRAGCD